MPTDRASLFKLPFPSSGTAGARFEKGLRRLCELSIDGEDENAELVRCCLKFEGVEAFRCTYLSSLTAEMIKTAYDQVVDLGDTDWLRNCSSRAVAFWQRHREQRNFRHLMVCFDDGPCYEFICCSFEAEIVPAAKSAG